MLEVLQLRRVELELSAVAAVAQQTADGPVAPAIVVTILVGDCSARGARVESGACEFAALLRMVEQCDLLVSSRVAGSGRGGGAARTGIGRRRCQDSEEKRSIQAAAA